jgi:two-component system, cell cycle response regulator
VLLARLGRQLREAVGENGTAYRFGGDEFCVLLTCGKGRLDTAKRNATRALTASGRGFDVTASWGAATIPGEASEPAEALQLADVRMYAQKESRRVAHDHDTAPEEVEVARWLRESSGAPELR